MSRTPGANTGNHKALTEALTDEADLVRRCRLGERPAEEQFYRSYRRSVAGNLYRILNDRSDLDDLVQEVFVIAFRGLAGFRGEARLSTWLYRITVNVALGRIRTKMRRPPPVLLAEPEPARDPTRGPPETPERSLSRQQERQRVYDVLEQLSPKKRAVFFLHEIEGYDLKEIAYLINANQVTVRTRLFYARKEFYKLLTETQLDIDAEISGVPRESGATGSESLRHDNTTDDDDSNNNDNNNNDRGAG